MTEQFSMEEWSRKSWVEAANDSASGFPLQSLPYCVVQGDDEVARPGVGIGDQVLNLTLCLREGLLAQQPESVRKACEAETLNALIACGQEAQNALRNRLTKLLDARAGAAVQSLIRGALVPMSDARLLKPVAPPNYTDFYASIHHATNVGRLFRPENPLLPNYKYVPIGYHGRVSSLVVSGTVVQRPSGQSKPEQAGGIPRFGPSRSLDYEVEVGMYIGEGNSLGQPISIEKAQRHLFGFTLVNDWSARDLQAWEYQPLGPFLGKSFATTVSPWVVPKSALEPFRIPAAQRAENDPAPLPYLWNIGDQEAGGLDLTVEVLLLTPAMRAARDEPHRLSRGNLRELYWTPAQMIAHHTSNGCNLMTGDLLATGTISGAEEDSAGCLLELTQGGAKPILLPNSERRTSLEDGDEVILRGFCRRNGFPDVSLGECRGLVGPAL